MKKLLLSMLLVPFLSQAQDTTGLIAHWAMNGDATDASGHGHDGTGHNVTLTTGMYGIANTAYLFNGTNSMITIPYSSSFNLNKVSICAIVKVNGFYSGFCEGNMIIARGIPSYTTTTGNYNLRFSDAGWNGCGTLDTTKQTFYLNCGSNILSASNLQYTPTIAEDHWYKIVAIFDSINYKIYIDGVLKDSVATSGSPIGTNSDSIVIGYDTWEAPSYPYPFNGAIDDIILFNRVLTDSEIVHYGDTCGVITLEPDPIVIPVGSTATFKVKSSAGNAASYQWQQKMDAGFADLTNTAPYSGVNTNTLTITGVTSSLSGSSYRCIVTGSATCRDISSSALLTATTGLNTIVDNNYISLYPNPAKNNIAIELPGSEGANVQIINAIGQVVLEKSFSGIKTQMDISTLPAGMFIVRIAYNDCIFTRKLLKE